MNKNLKKVISAAAALTISASSFAALAVDFPDVEATASYYQAVQELSALDIISGFEDGTFKPDELVTRAQITKMIVDALGFRNAAESAKGVATKFNDVASGENGHWASGYISVGVSKGFISGHSDTVFAPDDNVTYVQAQKMLVAALGYDSYAQQAGGWPTGYTAYATQKGITNGVKALSEDQLTRAQVAQMIDNAMDVPLVKVTGTTSSPFGSYPEYSEMDGTDGHMYETLFTDMDVYKVYGRVTATSRTNTSLDTDKVTFKVEKADNFDDEEITSKEPREEDMYFGNTNAESMIRTYAQALIQKNDDDEFTLLSLTPAAANKSVSLLAEDIDESKSDVNKNVLYFYPTGKNSGSTRYNLAADGADFYLNGVDMKRKFTAEDYTNYIVNNDTAMVMLQKETAVGSTSAASDYNVIMITACGTAVVSSVNDKNDTTTINFKKSSSDIKKTKMTLQKDDDNYRYTFKLNGEEIEPTELEEYDVLTIAYDTADFTDSTFYDVMVSRNVEENAKYKGVSSDKTEYTFGSNKYKMAIGQGNLTTSTEYTLYLDVNGRIAYVDEVANSKKIGIVKNAYIERGDETTVTLITKEGKTVDFTVDEAEYKQAQDIIEEAKAAADGDLAVQYANSVVEYKSTTANKITSLTAQTAAATADGEKEYKASLEKVDGVKVSDISVILDLSNVKNNKDDIKLISKDDLQDGVCYVAYGYDKSNSVCRFVLITEGAGGITSASKMVVFLGTSTYYDEDEGSELASIVVADPESDNGETEVVVDENAKFVIPEEASISDRDDIDEVLAEGDLIIYSTNTAGRIDEIAPVFNVKNALPSSFETLVNAQVAADAESMLSLADWKDLLGDNDEEDVNVIAGVVLDAGSNNFSLATTFATDDNGLYTNVNDAIDLTINEDARVYTYNYSNGTKNHGRITVNDGMVATSNNESAYEGGDTSKSKFYFSTTNADVQDAVDANDVVYAVARVYDDGEVQEIYLIVAE